MYLTVLGTGQWSYIGPDREKLRFPPGIHEVSEEVAEAARKSGRRTLMVTAEKPRVVTDGGDGPLKMEDLRVGTRGVRLVNEEVVEAPPEEDPEVPLEFPCGQCPRAFPSSAARKRHQEVHHDQPQV